MSAHSMFKVVSLCSLYMVLGPTLIMLNKYIYDDLDFPYPLFVSGLGVAVSALVSNLAITLGFVDLQRKDQVEGKLWYWRVLPVGLATATTLACGNSVYLLLDVGFIQMLKTFTPVIILLTGYIAKIENPSSPVIASIIVITIGTILTCTFQASFQPVGISVMLMSEIGEAIRLVLTQFLLQNLKFGVVEGQAVLAPASALWLFLASAVLELPTMVEKQSLRILVAHPWEFVVASLMGLGLNFLSYFVILVTSSLTMKVLGTLRNICTIFLGMIFYAEVVTLQEGLGYTLALLGFVTYNAAKMGMLEYSQTMNPWLVLCCHAKCLTGDLMAYVTLTRKRSMSWRDDEEARKLIESR